MTGDQTSRGHLAQRGRLRAAALDGSRAARMEGTTRRRIRRARRLAAQRGVNPRALQNRVGNGHGGEQRLGVRVLGARVELRRRREFDRSVTALVGEARDEGSVRSDIDPRVITRLLFGMINSIVEWYRADGPESADQLANEVLAMALEGLSAT